MKSKTVGGQRLQSFYNEVHKLLCPAQKAVFDNPMEGMKQLAVAATCFWMEHAPDGTEQDENVFLEFMLVAFDAVKTANLKVGPVAKEKTKETIH